MSGAQWSNIPKTEALMQLVDPSVMQPLRSPRHPSSRRGAMTVALTAMISLTGIACGSDGPLVPSLGGTGSVTATGAVSTSGSGLALFQSTSSGGASLFQVLVAPLSPTAVTWQLQIANYSGRPAAGTYTLSPLSPSSPDPTATFYYANGASMDAYNSVSGQLVITSSSSSSVRGTFSFTATNASGGAGSVTVQGSFNAECAPGLPCE